MKQLDFNLKHEISRTLLALCLLVFAVMPGQAQQSQHKEVSADVVVYGSTPAGISAAVYAAREGASVVLIHEDGHIGGLMSGGLSYTDFKSYESLGGAYREFMQRVKDYTLEHGGPDAMRNSAEGGYAAPSVARAIFEDMLEEAGVEVRLHHRITEAETTAGTDGRRQLTRAIFEATHQDASPKQLTVSAKVFIDATYEGDLMAAAGVEYIVGCESKDKYGESRAFDEPNDWVQTYNFRVCLTDASANRLPIPKPEGYDPAYFDILAEAIEKGTVKGPYEVGHEKNAVMAMRRIAAHKADFNDKWTSPMSLSIKNINHPWPDGSPEVREAIFEVYRKHSLGLLYFLSYDERVPEDWREQMLEWGLPKDEYVDNDNFSPQLYVREARRMVGEYVFTQHDTHTPNGHARTKLNRDSIAIGDYSINCHGVYAPKPGENVGKFFQIVNPFQVPYGTLVPKRVDGLLVPGAVSSSHVGFCALRMEPVWMSLGQAAGLAAVQSIEEQVELRDISVMKLQSKLHALGAKTAYVSDLGTLIKIPRPDWEQGKPALPAHLTSVPPKNPKLFMAVQFWATHGLFHDPELDGQDEGGRGHSGIGQWYAAYKGHSVGLDKPMDKVLAKRWINIASKQFPSLDLNDFASSNGLLDGTRGDFLIRLHNAAKAQDVSIN